MPHGQEGYDYGAYCGLYCGACALLLANERGTVAELLELEEPGYTVEDLTCRGCRTDVVARWCAECEMRRCARERAVAFCSACGDYPCEHNRAFRADEHPHHSAVLKNLAALAADGEEAWLAAQAERWKCPSCGARFTWYEVRCDGCGAALYGCREEERELPPREV
jgi:hypothetical protein